MWYKSKSSDLAAVLNMENHYFLIEKMTHALLNLK